MAGHGQSREILKRLLGVQTIVQVLYILPARALFVNTEDGQSRLVGIGGCMLLQAVDWKFPHPP